MYGLRKPSLVTSVTLLALVGWWAVVWPQEPGPDFVKEVREPGPKPPKIEAELAERLLALRAGETVAVGIWFTVPDYVAVQGMLQKQPRTRLLRQSVSAALAQRIEQGNQPLIAMLTAEGFELDYASTKAPVVFAALNGEMIETLAHREDVEAIYLCRTYVPAIEDASKTDRADVVWARGIDGSSATEVGVVEAPENGNPDGSRIDRPHDWVAGVNDATTAFRPGSPASDHATRVAGRIAALHNPPDRYRGVAPGVATLLSANSDGTTASIIEASDWALGEGADILNLSLEYRTDFSGVPNQLARYCDWVVYNHWRTVITVAGNEGNDAAHVVTNPGLSYNSITVGAYEDNDDFKWQNPDDLMAGYSCFRDPPDATPPVGTDRELPEVVAVGSTVQAPSLGSTIGPARNGTSFAAPGVAGVAALLLERRPSLVDKPEVIKAIIMAGACHNIEGDTRLSDRDGAGAVVACEADEIAANGQYYEKLLQGSDFDGPPPNGVWTHNGMTLERSLEARVVISWFVAVGGGPNYEYPAGGPLQADLDLWVYNPDGTLAAKSISYNNNYEIVEFVPAQTGVHRIEVKRISWPDGYETWLGIAWTQDPCCSPDWGDAPDDMMHCLPRPKRGDFPTKEISDGANVREFEVEWLSEDNTTSPGATWEMDAYVDPFQYEQDEDTVSNIDPANCLVDQDGEDDGVLPDPIYTAGDTGYVTFWVSSATPNVGRYSSALADIDEKIYVTGWFDWEHDDITWAGNEMVHWVGGPGMVGAMDKGVCVEGCDLWNQTAHQKKVTAKFKVPDFLPVGPFWIRFRMDYGENRESQTDTATYGEVEDHISHQALAPPFHGWHYGYDYYRSWEWPSWEYPSVYGVSEMSGYNLWIDVPWWWWCYTFPPPVGEFRFGIAIPQYFLDLGWTVVDVAFKEYAPEGGGTVLATFVADETISAELNANFDMGDGTTWFGYGLTNYDLPESTMVLYYRLIGPEPAEAMTGDFHFIAGDDLYGWSEEMYVYVPVTVSGCDCGFWGDVTGDGQINPQDVTFMQQYVFFTNDMRVPYPNCPYEVGDVNCDGQVNPQDVTFMVQYVFFTNDMFCADPCGP